MPQQALKQCCQKDAQKLAFSPAQAKEVTNTDQLLHYGLTHHLCGIGLSLCKAAASSLRAVGYCPNSFSTRRSRVVHTACASEVSFMKPAPNRKAG